jgi:hypothetical protein
VILAPKHAGGFSLTNYSELLGGPSVGIWLPNGRPALKGKSGRKTPMLAIRAKKRNIDAAEQSKHRLRLNSSGGPDLPEVQWI